MKRISITVSEDLHEQLLFVKNKLKEPMNVSRLCQEAIDEEVKRILKSHETIVLSAKGNCVIIA